MKVLYIRLLTGLYRVPNSIGYAKHPMFCGSKKKYKELGWSYRNKKK